MPAIAMVFMRNTRKPSATTLPSINIMSFFTEDLTCATIISWYYMG
jgi:hypothetical protein